MSGNSEIGVTALLHRWQAGDDAALQAMVPVVYDELQRLASAQLRRDAGASIQATELVAEAYMKLVDVDSVDWQSRAHFFSMAARVMRQLLVQRYRQRSAERRGGGRSPLTLVSELAGDADRALPLDELDEALTELERLDPRQAEIVILKFFGGLTVDEIALTLDLSTATIKREWAAARLWLADALGEP